MISQEMNIRTGKYGDYIFYKTKSMTKPRFLKLKGFKENYMECELITLKTWITATYKVAFN